MEPELPIVLLGNTGVGKSASGNTILRRAAFQSKSSFYPVTKQIREEAGQLLYKLIRVIDTPGILESEQEIRSFCQKLLQDSKHILFLVVIRVDRFNEEVQRAVEAAIRVVGEDGLRNTFLLFSCADALKNRPLEDVIRENDSLQKVSERFKGRFHLFNNKDGGQDQAEELLQNFLHPDVPADPVRLEERKIILIGRPGGGRSSSGNTILGSERFRSGCDFDPVSTETVSESAEVEGHQVTVVDTPGFTAEDVTHEQLYQEIKKMIMKADPGPHVFVIVARISQISEADKKLFEMLPKVFGSEASKYVMVLFTHGDQLGGQTIDQMIQSNSSVSDLVSMCAGRFCVFENSKRGNRQQVRELLRIIDEMVEANGGKHYTSEMLRMAETFIREEQNLPHQPAESGPSHQSIESGPSHQPAESGPSHQPAESGPSHQPAESGPSRKNKYNGQKKPSKKKFRNYFMPFFCKSDTVE